VTTQLHRFSFESHWQSAGVAGLDPALRRTLPPGRSCDQCRDCWGVGEVDHESDWASVRADGSSVYPGWLTLPRKQCWKVGPLDASSRPLVPQVVGQTFRGLTGRSSPKRSHHHTQEADTRQQES